MCLYIILANVTINVLHFLCDILLKTLEGILIFFGFLGFFGK